MVASKPRILVMSHGHPDFSLGGGEIAAYGLFRAYRESAEVEDAWFLAHADKGRGATGLITMRRPGEYLWEQAVHDWFSMRAVHQESLTSWFPDFLRTLRPTVVHTHHYAHFGLEHLRVIKEVDPEISVALTLHEYMGICANSGQMIKTDGVKLCSRESLEDCRRCYPNRTAEDFWLRKHFFERHFDFVDRFVAPSEFLRERYVAWGLAPERIVVIENGQKDADPVPPRRVVSGESRSRFGFFGQITPYKGLDVLLEALSQLKRKDRRNIVLEVHGANLESQPAPYREEIERLRGPLVDEGVVQWIGPYQPHELRARMGGVDWVVVPSIWWENSPMVIQEAFLCGRPLLVSDIGGMAEKVRDGVDGIHVPVGNRKRWAEALLDASTPSRWAECAGCIRHPLTHAECAARHLQMFVTVPDAGH